MLEENYTWQEIGESHGISASAARRWWLRNKDIPAINRDENGDWLHPAGAKGIKRKELDPRNVELLELFKAKLPNFLEIKKELEFIGYLEQLLKVSTLYDKTGDLKSRIRAILLLIEKIYESELKELQ